MNDDKKGLSLSAGAYPRGCSGCWSTVTQLRQNTEDHGIVCTYWTVSRRKSFDIARSTETKKTAIFNEN